LPLKLIQVCPSEAVRDGVPMNQKIALPQNRPQIVFGRLHVMSAISAAQPPGSPRS